MKILDINNYGNQRMEALKRLKSQKDSKNKKIFSKIFTTTLLNHNQSDWSASNESVSIEDIFVEHVFEKQNCSNNNIFRMQNFQFSNNLFLMIVHSMAAPKQIT